jgi:hypothetical protein
MKRRVLRRGALAAAGAAALTVATAMPGNAATTAEWRFSSYESSLTGSMESVVAISRTDAWAEGLIYHGETPVNSPYVLHWNGAKWSAVTIPGSSGYSSSQVSASSASNVWVLGTDAKGTLNQKIFRFDGAHWHTMSVPEGNLDNLMVLSATDVWVTGQISCTISPKASKCVTDVWQWNGSKWLAHPINSTVYSIDASSAANVWVVGLGGVNQKGEGTVAAYRWAGTHWTPVTMSHPDMSGWPDIAMGSASNIWIEGGRGTTSQVLALHWTGSKWQQVISPAGDAASPGAVPYGSSGVWMGPWVAWTGRGWISTLQHLPFSGGTIHDVVPIPGASGSYWGAASVETSAKSSVDHPAMVVYGPVP